MNGLTENLAASSRITATAAAEAAQRREAGAKVRQTIQELGGTMPEELPVAGSIKKIETNQRKRLGKVEPPVKKEP